jgi:hypothetical protein
LGDLGLLTGVILVAIRSPSVIASVWIVIHGYRAANGNPDVCASCRVEIVAPGTRNTHPKKNRAFSPVLLIRHRSYLAVPVPNPFAIVKIVSGVACLWLAGKVGSSAFCEGNLPSAHVITNWFIPSNSLEL